MRRAVLQARLDTITRPNTMRAWAALLAALAVMHGAWAGSEYVRPTNGDCIPAGAFKPEGVSLYPERYMLEGQKTQDAFYTEVRRP